MKNSTKSPFLIALIALSMIASTVSPSAAYANTPAQDAAQKEKDARAAADKLKEQQAEQQRIQAQQAADKLKAQQAEQQRLPAEAAAKSKPAPPAPAPVPAPVATHPPVVAPSLPAPGPSQADKERTERAASDAAQKAKEQATRDAQKRTSPTQPAPEPAPPKTETKAQTPQPPPPVTTADKGKTQTAPPAPVQIPAPPKAEARPQPIQPAPAPIDRDAQSRADKLKADKIAQDKASADRALADKATREAQEAKERASKKQNPIATNPVTAPPAVAVKVESKDDVKAKLDAAKGQSDAQAAALKAQHDREAQAEALDAARKSSDVNAKRAQQDKIEAAQKEAEQKAQALATQKAQEQAAVKAHNQNQAPAKSAAQQAEDSKKQADLKLKAQTVNPVQVAQTRQKNEAEQATLVTKALDKKQIVDDKKKETQIVQQSTDLKNLSKPGAQPNASQQQVIAQNKKAYEDKLAANKDKPVVVAPTHAAAVVELKVVDGKRIGLDPHAPVAEVKSKFVPVAPKQLNGQPIPSYLASKDSQERLHKANIRSEEIHNTIINRTDVKSVTIVKNITNVTNVYVNNYQNVVVERSRVYNNYYYTPVYKNYYSGFYDYGFRGGYAYPVRVDIRIHEHFWNPLVLWMFDDSNNHDFYCQYYGDAYCYSYPISPFRYARVYYPTDTMRDLALEVSGMEYYRHTYYRTALEVMTDSLNQQISNYVAGRFYFGPNDIVINHYRNLGYGKIMIEGFVDRGELHVAFKGLLDLENPYNSKVFVPTVTNYAALPSLAVSILNLIVELEHKADVAEGVPVGTVYQEPAPPQLPPVQITCKTFSGIYKGTSTTTDSGTSTQAALTQCTSNSSADPTECKLNMSCDDGVAVAPLVTCSTSSTDNNNSPLSFIRSGRDADYTSRMAEQTCVASNATADVDACASNDNKTCVALDNSVISLMVCNVNVQNSMPNGLSFFTSQSYDPDKARNNAISKCVIADGTAVDDCNNTANLSCDYVAGAAPPPIVSCTATDLQKKTYVSGPMATTDEAYNAAVKACAKGGLARGVDFTTNLANCQKTANESCRQR